ncbi:MAG: hypothetical protein VYA67_01170 [Actinomycetota bacterium]|uniref:Uncharacterized protein n=1 Tax=Mycobacterium lentiflavum TaxID=141349 RepID=A0ABY5T266_MYCLN|nr:hypothetical protein [Mycobacterium lentiflavum]MEE3062565.1 hypothetical protein [Actinomycetota bacterium]UVI52112.1 hypothetical protein MJO58_28680 [Mycobacterium lentiflavum]
MDGRPFLRITGRFEILSELAILTSDILGRSSTTTSFVSQLP